MYENELYHFGIKGMKWGVRRFETKSGKLTPAGKERYADMANKYDEMKRINSNKSSSNRKKRYAREDYKDAKDYFKAGNRKKKSNHEQNLIDKYKSQGMGQRDAEISAYRRVKTEKILAGVAGVTAVTAAALVARHMYKTRVDKILKGGTLLQNISGFDNKDTKNAYYATDNIKDMIKYRGLYGKQLMDSGYPEIYKTMMKVDANGIKIASQNNAKKALEELLNEDSDAKNYFTAKLKSLNGSIQLVAGAPKQATMISDAYNDFINKGKVTSKVYDAANLFLSDNTQKTKNGFPSKFYNKLKQKGYDAIEDINDKKYSGYGSKNPVIIFGGEAKSKVVERVKLNVNEMMKDYNKGYALINVREGRNYLLQNLGLNVAPIVGGLVTMKATQSVSNSRLIRKYRKEYPNSKLTNREILKSYGR